MGVCWWETEEQKFKKFDLDREIKYVEVQANKLKQVLAGKSGTKSN